MNCRLLLAFFGLSLAALTQGSADKSDLPARPASGQPWGVKKAWNWHRQAGPIRGCNYLPRTAVNSTEMWQAETFDPQTIDQELGWAEALGYNSVRLFLQFVVWQQDPKGFKQRLNQFLRIAGQHRIRVMLILFDDCAFAGREPYLGKQDEPVPGVHNSGWVPSPGLRRVTDRTAWPELEKYVKDVVGSFAQDRRVLIWDLYNEPGNSNLCDKSLPLVEATFAWARVAKPSQPLTMGPWADFDSLLSRRMFELSDVISFHGYDAPDGLRKKIELCRSFGRPVICTEWLRRQVGNTFAAILPILAEQNVGWYHWGLVAGRTQTYLPWESKKGDPPPKVWQHDVLQPDGTPYDAKEADLLRAQRRNRGR
ncbi:MAG: 1,4-beta-xylanase [Verrucomicrobiota bacterium]